MKAPSPISRVLRSRLDGAGGRNIAALALAVQFVAGCGGSDETGAKPSAPQGNAVVESATVKDDALPKPRGNVISGRVTMEDGSPLRGDIKDIRISINGVSEAAQRVSYTPVVKSDGTYSQKVAGGQYAFSHSDLVMLYGDVEFNLALEPVGRDWNKNRDAEEGIVQDFLFRVTGPTLYGRSSGLNAGNHTHWHGQSIGLLAETYRNDIKQSALPIPAGAKLTFTLQPQGPAIDGRTIQPTTVERTYTDRYQTLDLNDLVPAPYELSGTATLPDGTKKPILLQGPGDYPKYKPAVNLPLQNDGSLSLRIKKHGVTFLIE